MTLFIDPISMPPEQELINLLKEVYSEGSFESWTAVETDDEVMCDMAVDALNRALSSEYHITRVIDANSDGDMSGGYYFLLDVWPGPGRLSSLFQSWSYLRGDNRDGLPGVVDYLRNVVRAANESIEMINRSIGGVVESARPEGEI